jgi:hypothetical protein
LISLGEGERRAHADQIVGQHVPHWTLAEPFPKVAGTGQAPLVAVILPNDERNSAVRDLI